MQSPRWIKPKTLYLPENVTDMGPLSQDEAIHCIPKGILDFCIINLITSVITSQQYSSTQTHKQPLHLPATIRRPQTLFVAAPDVSLRNRQPYEPFSPAPSCRIIRHVPHSPRCHYALDYAPRGCNSN